jgi:hypothetical protein
MDALAAAQVPADDITLAHDPLDPLAVDPHTLGAVRWSSAATP